MNILICMALAITFTVLVFKYLEGDFSGAGRAEDRPWWPTIMIVLFSGFMGFLVGSVALIG